MKGYAYMSSMNSILSQNILKPASCTTHLNKELSRDDYKCGLRSFHPRLVRREPKWTSLHAKQRSLCSAVWSGTRRKCPVMICRSLASAWVTFIWRVGSKGWRTTSRRRISTTDQWMAMATLTGATRSTLIICHRSDEFWSRRRTTSGVWIRVRIKCRLFWLFKFGTMTNSLQYLHKFNYLLFNF